MRNLQLKHVKFFSGITQQFKDAAQGSQVPTLNLRLHSCVGEHPLIWWWSTLSQHRTGRERGSKPLRSQSTGRLHSLKNWLRGDLSTLCNILRKGRTEGGASLFSLGISVRTVGMAQSCVKWGSDWALGKICLLWVWSNTGTGLLQRCLKLHACQFNRYLDHAYW